MANYDKKARKRLAQAIKAFEEGTLKIGTSGKKVTSRKQALAIGLSQARKEGDKVPAPKKKK